MRMKCRNNTRKEDVKRINIIKQSYLTVLGTSPPDFLGTSRSAVPRTSHFNVPGISQFNLLGAYFGRISQDVLRTLLCCLLDPSKFHFTFFSKVYAIIKGLFRTQ